MEPASQRPLSASRCLVVLVCLAMSSPVWAAKGPRRDAPPPGQSATVTPEQVEQAIKKAKEYLYSKQHNGNWENIAKRRGDDGSKTEDGQWGGLTAICTYALLASEDSPQDPRLKQAINFLLEADIIGYYALGMRCQMYPFLRTQGPEVKNAIKRDYALLKEGMKSQGADIKGFYDYVKNSGDRIDRSVSQYGVLGMWAVAQTNYEVPLEYWITVDHAWREAQHASGAWNYEDRKQPAETVSMTAAGIATLFITQDYINQGKGGDCKGNLRDEHVEKALKWMAEHYSEMRGKRTYYTLYGIERIGVASGYKYFGTINWYEDGAEHLVKGQRDDGSWGDLPDTCFGILFLVRGRAPVVMNKLMYDIDRAGDKPVQAHWNQRHRDLANFSHWLSKQTERYLNWQIVNLQVPPEDLHDAPLLYISGDQSLNFTAQEEAKLKAFVQQGGIILGNADCASSQFSQAFKKLGSKLFPGYEFRELPADHPIFVGQTYSRKNWKAAPKLLGLTNGARELMLLLPDTDPARFWQTQSFLGKEDIHQLVADIFFYAVDKKNLRAKGETYMVKADATQATSKMKVARLEYGGNWDPEPGGWQRLAAVMHNARGTDVTVENVKLGGGKLDRSYQVAHLTGTSKFKFTGSEALELKNYLQLGGTLIVDATGGSTEFAAAAETELAAMLGTTGVLPTLAADHAVYNAGVKITDVGYRLFARKTMGNIHTPQIRGLEQDGRVKVLYSREDLSVGLVGQAVDGINGYQPSATKDQESGKTTYGATELMANMLSYALSKATPDAKAVAAAGNVAAAPENKPTPAPVSPPTKGKKPK